MESNRISLCIQIKQLHWKQPGKHLSLNKFLLHPIYIISTVLPLGSIAATKKVKKKQLGRNLIELPSNNFNPVTLWWKQIKLVDKKEVSTNLINLLKKPKD